MTSVTSRRQAQVHTTGAQRTAAVNGQRPAATQHGSATGQVQASGKVPVLKPTYKGMASLKNGFDASNLVPSPGTSTTLKPDPKQGGKATRGFIEVTATPSANGCQVKIKSHHADVADKVTLVLQGRVIDKGEEHLLTLAVLADEEVLNKTGYTAERVYEIDYASINKYLAKSTPHIKVGPGTPLAVGALWEVSHQWGGFNRGGFFNAPAPTQGNNVIALRAQAAKPAAAGKNAGDIPLDAAVAFGPDILKEWPKVLDKQGAITTRLESEFKGNARSEAELEAAVKKMYAMAADKKLCEKILGKDWEVEAIDRHHLKDKRGRTIMDPRGFPATDPMIDVYFDTPSYDVTQKKSAIRIRSNEQKTGRLNIKGTPNPDKNGVSQRVEYGLDLKPGVKVKDLLAFLDQDSTIYNTGWEELQSQGYISASDLEEAFKVIGDRHKFKISNKKTGVEAELSLDFTTVQDLRRKDKHGKPLEARFGQVEMELDHLQVNSSNMQAAVRTATGSYVDAPTTEAEQQKVLKKLGKDASMEVGIEPFIHKFEHTKNKAFRQSASYVEFQSLVSGKLLTSLFPKGLTPGAQKAYTGAKLMKSI